MKLRRAFLPMPGSVQDTVVARLAWPGLDTSDTSARTLGSCGFTRSTLRAGGVKRDADGVCVCNLCVMKCFSPEYAMVKGCWMCLSFTAPRTSAALAGRSVIMLALLRHFSPQFSYFGPVGPVGPVGVLVKR